MSHPGARGRERVKTKKGFEIMDNFRTTQFSLKPVYEIFISKIEKAIESAKIAVKTLCLEHIVLFYLTIENYEKLKNINLLSLS